MKYFYLAVRSQSNLKLSIIRDEPDNRFLELAVSGVADFLIQEIVGIFYSEVMNP